MRKIIQKFYLNPFFSTDPSVLNLTIMKLEADIKDLFPRSCFPDRVAKLTALSSVRPPTKICTVSNVFSVSNSWN